MLLLSFIYCYLIRNNIASFFHKKKRELSKNCSDGKDAKKQREASSLELSFEKASDGDVFKDSLKSEDCILILKICMENFEKKMEELCIATKNIKKSQIKDELQLVCMKETINYINKKHHEIQKDTREKDGTIKILSQKASKMTQSIDKLVKLVDRTRAIFTV